MVVEPQPPTGQKTLNTDESSSAHKENDKRAWGITTLTLTVLLKGVVDSYEHRNEGKRGR